MEPLAARLARGDEAAFAELYERYFDDVYDFALRIVGASRPAAPLPCGSLPGMEPVMCSRPGFLLTKMWPIAPASIARARRTGLRRAR